MLKKSVKITYAEPWLPLHHRLFIEVVETCSARFALKKRYDNYTKNVQNKIGNDCWDLALNSLGVQFPNLNLPKKNKNKGLIIAANHPYGVTDGVILSWLASRYDSDFSFNFPREPIHNVYPIFLYFLMVSGSSGISNCFLVVLCRTLMVLLSSSIRLSQSG